MFRHASTLSDIVTSLDVPAEKFPSLVVLTGNAQNASLMSQVLPSLRKRADRQEPNGLCLQLDPDTAFSDHPTLIAYNNIPKRITCTSEPTIAAGCHRHTIRELQWLVSSTAEAVNNLYNRLVSPFADLVCFFSTTDGNMQSCVEQMVPWILGNAGLAHRSSFCPRLLLIAAPSESRSPSDVLTELVKLLQQRLEDPRADSYSYISVYVQKGSTHTLKERVRKECNMAQKLRARKNVTLNAIHFDSLFRNACDHFVTTIKEPFNMLSASRLHRPVPAGLQTRLADLLVHVDTHEDLTAFAAPYIAGCLALDNYAYDVPC